MAKYDPLLGRIVTEQGDESSGGGGLTTNVEDLTADKTLVEGDANIQILNGGTAERTITLPPPFADGYIAITNSGSEFNFIISDPTLNGYDLYDADPNGDNGPPANTDFLEAYLFSSSDSPLNGDDVFKNSHNKFMAWDSSNNHWVLVSDLANVGSGMEAFIGGANPTDTFNMNMEMGTIGSELLTAGTIKPNGGNIDFVSDGITWGKKYIPKVPVLLEYLGGYTLNPDQDYIHYASPATNSIIMSWALTGTPNAGDKSISMGYNSMANGSSCISIGTNVTANDSANSNCICIGRDAKIISSAASDNTVIGHGATAFSTKNISIGYNSAARGWGIAIGSYVACDSQYGIAIGDGVSSTGQYGVAMGKSAKSNKNTVSIGPYTGYNSTGENCVLIGTNAGGRVTGQGNVVIGYYTSSSDVLTTAADCVLIGKDAGRGRVTTQSGVILIGKDCCNGYVGTMVVRDVFIGKNDKWTIHGNLDLNYAVTPASSTPAPDAKLWNQSINYYIDESTNKLMVKVKYSDGTIKTGEVANLT